MKIRKSPKGNRSARKPTVTVDRRFLVELARTIYDGKNKRFLRLCSGTLKNGPDPTDGKRSMHCGLGELYFAMTGKQPERTRINEEEVVDLAVQLSPLNNLRARAVADMKARIKKMHVPPELRSRFFLAVDEDVEGWYDGSSEESFRDALDRIPGINDGVCDHKRACTTAQYKQRSKVVAAALRRAAKFLPR
jgi:hypothetical protein